MQVFGLSLFGPIFALVFWDDLLQDGVQGWGTLVMLILLPLITTFITSPKLFIRGWRQMKSVRRRKVDLRRERRAPSLSGNVNAMTGDQFEELLAKVFGLLKFGVKRTGKGGADFGVDLLLTKGRHKIAVQAKRYTGNVGNDAVQAVYAGMRHYGAGEAWVVTNSYFTEPARKQAKSCGVRLVDHDELIDMVLKARKRESGGGSRTPWVALGLILICITGSIWWAVTGDISTVTDAMDDVIGSISGTMDDVSPDVERAFDKVVDLLPEAVGPYTIQADDAVSPSTTTQSPPTNNMTVEERPQTPFDRTIWP